MTTRTWSGAAAAMVIALGGCAHGERKAEARSPRDAAAAEAQRAAQQAAQTDRALAQARQQLEGARQETGKAQQAQGQARQQLAQAEQRANQAQQRLAQEQAHVQQLEAASQQQHQQAAVAAERAETAAEQAQLAAEEAQGLRTVAGRVAEASPSRVVLESRDGQRMAFQVTQGTKVLVGSQQRSVAELQQGAEARVAYDPRSDQPAAAVIHVSRAQGTPFQAPAQPQR